MEWVEQRSRKLGPSVHPSASVWCGGGVVWWSRVESRSHAKDSPFLPSAVTAAVKAMPPEKTQHNNV